MNDDKLNTAIKLSRGLKAKLHGEVRFDAGTKAIYSMDASNYRQIPIGVVFPKSKEDIVLGVEICKRFKVPVLMRGGGTSLAGQCCNSAVIFDTTKYFNRILEINPAAKIARIEPGVILDELRKEAEKYDLTFGPDPATHDHCSLGGMIGNNSCGVHAQMAGKTVDNVQELEILTYDGRKMRVGPMSENELQKKISSNDHESNIYQKVRALRDQYSDLIRNRYPKIPRLVSGFSLDQLLPENEFNLARALVGTEGTCVSILEATVNLIDSPKARVLLVVGFKSIAEAGRCVPAILEYAPIGLEGIDAKLYNLTKKKGAHPAGIREFPKGNGWLLIEMGGANKNDAKKKARKLIKKLKNLKSIEDFVLETDDAGQKLIWEIRESGLGTTAFPIEGGDSWPGWEDAAVHPDKIGDYLEEFDGLLSEYDYHGALYGHFGQGCIHTRIDFDLVTNQGIKKYLSFVDKASDLILKYGGSFSGEHGDGQARGKLLKKMFGEELIGAFKEFKSIWDPEGKMNPGKVIDPFSIDENLKLGTDYSPQVQKTYFTYPEDNGSFAHATLRCVGVGKCRRKSGGTMCPSYMVTGEEKHTTRGRAHALFEMLNGQVIDRGWRSKVVQETLDLCLACKGCKNDCPVNVDMATYKAEFLAHYYKNRLRPPHAYAMGFIDKWSVLATKIPRLANYLSHAFPFASIAKAAVGIAPQRELPKFANQTFHSWFEHREPRADNLPKDRQVLLWADTFSNYFHPEVTKSATSILENAGFQVNVPRVHLCCGRPLYDFGFLNQAKKYLDRILVTLRDSIRDGIPIVVLEPSCLAVFRDEMLNLMPHNIDAKRLKKNVYSLAEFISSHKNSFHLPMQLTSAIVHGHCHQKSLWGLDAEKEILKIMAVDFQILDSGCCGMAGSFGFEKEKYKVSIACGERVLLPAVRDSDARTLHIADGFSCREQISQQTNKKALHLAEFICLLSNSDVTKRQDVTINK